MSLCTLADVKAQLNKTGTADDTELQAYIDAASAVIDRIYGPFSQATKTWTTSGGWRSITVPDYNVTVTTVTENGTTLTVDVDFVVDSVGGVLSRGNNRWPLTWLAGQRNIVITYTVGSATIPPDVNLAARTIVQEWWELQRGPRPLPLQGGTDVAPDTGFRTFTLRRAAEMLSGLSTPGFA